VIKIKNVIHLVHIVLFQANEPVRDVKLPSSEVYGMKKIRVDEHMPTVSLVSFSKNPQAPIEIQVAG
jgi:hypothetical protein